MADTVEVIILGKDEASPAFKSVEQSARGMGQNIRGPLAGASKAAGAALIGIGAAAVAGFGIAAGASINMNAQLETSQLQFQTLMGSAEEAETHVAGLFEFAQKTPFETQPIIDASIALQTFGGDALNTMANIQLLGDASAAVNAPIEDLGFWIGRAYSQIQAGKPFGEAAMRLQELAVLSPEARAEMEALQEAGAGADEVFAVLTDDLGRFSGAMELQAGTWQGLTSTIKDSLMLLAADALRPFFDLAKEGLASLAEWLNNPEVQAGIQAFANGFAILIGQAVEFITTFVVPFVQEHGPTLMTVIGTIVTALGAFSIISTVVGWVTGLISAISAFGAAITAAGSIVGGIIAILGGPLTVVIAIVAGAIALLAAAWANNWGGIRDKVAAAWGAIQPILQAVGDWLSVQIPAALEVLRAIWVDVVWPAIQAVFTAVIGNIQDIWTAFSLLFKGDFEGLGKFLREKWTETWETIKRFITEILPAIAGELSKFWSAYVLPWLQNLLASFVGWWNGVMGEFRAIGNRVIQGLLAGMQAQAGAVRAWITSFVGDIIAAVKRLFGIASPSRVMRSIGVDFVEGFIVGIDQFTGQAITAVMELGTSIADAFIATLEGVEDRAAALFDFGGKIGQMANSFAGFFQSQTLEPIQNEIDGLTQSMSDMAASLWGEGFGGDFMAMDTTAKRLELLAMLNESDNFLEQESLRQMLAMLDEREQLQAEYLRQKEREAELAELTAQGNFLKQQMDLIKLVTENGLSASILQGLNLGIGADPGRIMEALTAAYGEMVANMAAQVAMEGGTPNDRSGENGRGGSTVINIDARRAERGAAADIRSAVEMVLRDYGIRGDIRVRTT